MIRDGGEGNRTPDLLNAIQALSQLSYAPVRTLSYQQIQPLSAAFTCFQLLSAAFDCVQQTPVDESCRQEPRIIAGGISSVNEMGLAEIL